MEKCRTILHQKDLLVGALRFELKTPAPKTDRSILRTTCLGANHVLARAKTRVKCGSDRRTAYANQAENGCRTFWRVGTAGLGMCQDWKKKNGCKKEHDARRYFHWVFQS
jgi:hypothetical protein